MPSHQDNLAAVRAACIAANPEIADREKYRHECAMCHEVEDYEPEIGLGDVLLALQEKYPLRKKEMFDYDLDAYESELLCLLSRKGPVAYNLKTPLSGQSEETVSYLAALLKNND